MTNLHADYAKLKEKYKKLKSVFTNNGAYYIDKNDQVDIVYKNKSLIHRVQSKYQKIEVFTHDFFGNILVIDDDLQLTQHDESIYHEMITHVPLNYLENAKKVLIIGGGDCGTLTEVTKHSNVEEILMIEIDPEVVNTSVRYFKELTQGLYDKRTNLIFADGAKWMRDNLESYRKYFDVIIIDSTDYSTAMSLFTDKFYKNISVVLRDRGIFCFNCMSISWESEYMKHVYKQMFKCFKYVNLYQAFIPTYASGHYAFCVCSNKIDPINTPINFSAFEKKKIPCKYYNKSIHLSSFNLPNEYQGKGIHTHDLGRTFTIDVKGVGFEYLNNLEIIKNLLDDICIKYRLHVIHKQEKEFKPHGITMAYMLAESHLTIHTWPEFGKCCLDLYTCGKFQWYLKNNDTLATIISKNFRIDKDKITVNCVDRIF